MRLKSDRPGSDVANFERNTRDRNDMPSSGSMSFVKTLAQRTAQRQGTPANTSHVPSTDFAPSDTSGLTAGMRVEHMKFGFGAVKSVDINGTERKAVIQFDTVGEKTATPEFCQIENSYNALV